MTYKNAKWSYRIVRENIQYKTGKRKFIKRVGYSRLSQVKAKVEKELIRLRSDTETTKSQSKLSKEKLQYYKI